MYMYTNTKSGKASMSTHYSHHTQHKHTHQNFVDKNKFHHPSFISSPHLCAVPFAQMNGRSSTRGVPTLLKDSMINYHWAKSEWYTGKLVRHIKKPRGAIKTTNSNPVWWLVSWSNDPADSIVDLSPFTFKLRSPGQWILINQRLAISLSKKELPVKKKGKLNTKQRSSSSSTATSKNKTESTTTTTTTTTTTKKKINTKTKTKSKTNSVGSSIIKKRSRAEPAASNKRQRTKINSDHSSPSPSPPQAAATSNRDRINKTGFKGVAKQGKKYTAQIRIHGENQYLGTFNTAKNAGIAWDRAAIKSGRPSSDLNFPKKKKWNKKEKID